MQFLLPTIDGILFDSNWNIKLLVKLIEEDLNQNKKKEDTMIQTLKSFYALMKKDKICYNAVARI